MSPRLPRPRRILACALVALAVVLGSVPSRAANDLVLRLSSSGSTVIAGESTVANHVGEIDILAMSWGVSAPRATSGGGTTTATANYLTLTKRLDKSSAPLMLAVFQGTHYPTAILFVRNQGTTSLDFFKVTMTDVVVNSYQTSGTTNESLVETISLSFGTIKFDYQPQNPDGSANGGVVSAGWNITTNQKM